MEIVHRITDNFDLEKQQQLALNGIKVNVGLDTFLVYESNVAWKQIKSLTVNLGSVDFVSTKFIRSELVGADLLELGPSWHHGYPEPSDDDGYKELTYDLRQACSTCGAGTIQKAPFRMKSEPKWGKKHLLQLNWIFDKYFVTPDAYETVFKPFGIGCCEVVQNCSDSVLSTVLQLRIDHVSSCPLSMNGIDPQICEHCNRQKYLPHTRGMFPALQGSFDEPIFKTQEYFGSGASAWQAIIISSQLYSAIAKAGLKGVTFAPLEASKKRGKGQ